jgi:hypothetical protein
VFFADWAGEDGLTCQGEFARALFAGHQPRPDDIGMGPGTPAHLAAGDLVLPVGDGGVREQIRLDDLATRGVRFRASRLYLRAVLPDR